MSEVFVVMIDIKDGYYDAIHAFTSAAAAEKYIAWQDARGGDHCYICTLLLEDEWAPEGEEFFRAGA